MTYNKYRLSIFYVGICLLFLLGSCNKSFIDGLKPTNSASPSDVFASTDAVRVYFNGIYRTMRSQWQSTDGSAGGATDTWGYNSVFMARDVKGKDIVMPYNSWYYFDYQNGNREPTYRRVKFTWYFFYELMNQINVLIDGTTKSATINDNDKKTILAEARALRAWYLFELAREFSDPFSKDPTAKGVPIYTSPAADSTKGNPRGTLQQTFDQINSDIEFATANIGTGQLLKDQVNTNVAWGMAARIYLEQGRWADAETAAINAISGHSLDAGGYPDNYNGLTSSEVIWGFPQTTQNGGQSLYYGTPSSFFVQDGSGYDAFWMSADLVNSFSLTDVRNTFYVYDPNSTQADAYGTNKFGTAQGSSYSVPLLNGQTVALKTIDFNESLNMMRVGEMYLIEAEAKARQSKADAGDVLFALQSNRDPSAVKSGNTGQALINEILLERRKELYGELGIDWLDSKRLQLPVDRSTSNHPAPYNYVIPANDPRFELKIPQAELQSNKSMTNGDQNP
jgi:hypothetical protein